MKRDVRSLHPLRIACSVTSVSLAMLLLAACAGGAQPLSGTPVVTATPTAAAAREPTSSQPEHAPTAENAAEISSTPPSVASEIVVYASELPSSALYEFDFWEDPASPMGTMVGTPNEGGELDPPPENDPNVTFAVPVRAGVPYRCWIHMKVGAPKGWSQANVLWVQFTDAVDEAHNEVFAPKSDSYLTAQGPTEQGWAWVECKLADADPSDVLLYFRVDGEITVRLQAGMEGVGFDQVVLSPARFLDEAPSTAVVEKVE